MKQSQKSVDEIKKKKAIHKMWSLRGTLKNDFPDMDSVAVAKTAFGKKNIPDHESKKCPKKITKKP